MKIRVRISLTGDDLMLIVNSNETVASAKKKLQELVNSKDASHVSFTSFAINLP